MSTEVIGGPLSVSLSRDAEGYRTYKIKRLVKASPHSGAGVGDGPFSVLNTPGLYLPGAMWAYGGEVDPWVWCRPDAVVEPYSQRDDNSPFDWWTVEQTFSNKPLPRDQQRCGDLAIEDPLLEPQKVSGTFIKHTKEQRTAEFVYHNDVQIGLEVGTSGTYEFPIVNSAWEPITGPAAEFDEHKAQIRIVQNVPLLQLALLVEALRNPLNDAPLWGLPARCVKLSEVSWEKRYHGLCYVYFTRTLVFDTDHETFDREVDDVGTKVLHGHWGTGTHPPTGTNEGVGWIIDPLDSAGLFQPDPDNPADFDRFTDRNGNPTTVVLNGRGVPWDPGGLTTGTADDTAGTVTIGFYGESNLLLLGIPTDLEV